MKASTFLSRSGYDTLLDAGCHMIDTLIESANQGHLDVTRIPKHVPFVNLRVLDVVDVGYAEFLKYTDKWPAINVTCTKICLDYVKSHMV